MKRKCNNYYQAYKIKQKMRHTHLPMRIWTKAKFLSEISRVNSTIDCKAIPLDWLKDNLLEYKGSCQVDQYKDMYFYGLNRERVKALRQDDIDTIIDQMRKK